MSYINRAIEEVFLKKTKTAKSIAITGARQVGKTTLTTKLFPSVESYNIKILATESVSINERKEQRLLAALVCYVLE